ncbi:MAG TPA: 3-oxoacyl-ACP reductase family protein [Terracidiphilus sp.]|jgi:acetoacetyl-CoA reductase/3-oxoacyl-[acyl-carrier protein] reductase|nr:3-oxoacyl-ACP reductase family protein [Terracidiphilus sp.]
MATATLSEVMVPASKALAGKVALVTGASRGIGRAIAFELACRGATVAVNCRANLLGAKEVRDGIVDAGGASEVFQGDVSGNLGARSLVRDVIDAYARVDILVNNAGITRDRSIRKMTDDDWTEVIETNLNSAFYCTSAALPSMIERNYGRIVNIASFVGQAGNFGQANYAASKGGLIAFTKVLALELVKYNITANVIAPGFTATEMTERIPVERLEAIKDRIPMHRLALPEEIAKAVAFLICDGDYITGQQVNINGGIYM